MTRVLNPSRQPIVIEWQEAPQMQLEELARWIRGCPSSQRVHVFVGSQEPPQRRRNVIRTFQALGCTVTSRLSPAMALA